MRVLVMFSIFLLAGYLRGETTLKQVRMQHSPGEMLHYTIKFEGNPDFSAVRLVFRSKDRPSQGLANKTFTLDQSVKLGPGSFEIHGRIPKDITTGTYDLIVVEGQKNPFGFEKYDAKGLCDSFKVDNPAIQNSQPLIPVIPK